ncbi:MAG: radical SAM protein [Flavisolibacter sp.]
MNLPSPYHTLQRYRTLLTHRIYALPIVILMPHSACNCRCVMCDIWKDNKNLKQLHEEDIVGLLQSLKSLGTRQVLMSGGEALLNARFFDLCRILKKQKIRISLLSTGLLLKKHAASIASYIDELIVSLDGDENLHDLIRQTPGAFAKLKEGIETIRSYNPGYRVNARTVIHRMNFHAWPSIIDTAKRAGINRVSFLPADVSSQAFNRNIPWNLDRQMDLMLHEDDLPLMRDILDHLYDQYKKDFDSGYIAESPGKLEMIYQYYRACLGLDNYPYKKCNAPWVSAVIEPDGAVRPCFFHASTGNIREQSLKKILNGRAALQFRKTMDMDRNPTCKRCVCYLNLPPTARA